MHGCVGLVEPENACKCVILRLAGGTSVLHPGLTPDRKSA
jgi:hypothetical protein